jgi:hypothetical protein
MSEFLSCQVLLGKHRYVGAWREVGEWTFVCMGDAWDCARTLHHPPGRVAKMLLKRMVEKGLTPVAATRQPAFEPPTLFARAA